MEQIDDRGDGKRFAGDIEVECGTEEIMGWVWGTVGNKVPWLYVQDALKTIYLEKQYISWNLFWNKMPCFC